jgi:hypothetical protein
MKEENIRPKEIFSKFLALAKQDAETYFARARTTQIVCPACLTRGRHAFSKDGFTYALCPRCDTLFVSPRPEAEAFRAFYTESPSSRFWAETFYPATAEARRELVWRPKAIQIHEYVEKHLNAACQVVDIGGGFGLFALEIMRLGQSVLVIEPSPSLAMACRNAGIPVAEKFLEDILATDLGPQSKCFVSFELFEHLHSPNEFLCRLSEHMSPNDIFCFTTLSGIGADIQALWGDSPSVSPPHHINFFNPFSIEILLARTGFQVIEITTPGKLDISIMENNIEHLKDRFWRTTLRHATEERKEQLQQCLRANLLSSHMMVLARKAAS